MNQADVYGELGFYLNYENINTEKEKKAFLEQGFEIAEVKNVIPYATHTPNYVLSLRK